MTENKKVLISAYDVLLSKKRFGKCLITKAIRGEAFMNLVLVTAAAVHFRRKR